MSEMIDVIMALLDGKLYKMLVNLSQIPTHNPLWVDFNTCFFCYFSQIGMHYHNLNFGLVTKVRVWKGAS
jgi:hypothetical protein